MLIWPINQSKEFPKYLNPILILQNRLTRGLGPERSRNLSFISSVRSSYSHPDLLVTHHQHHPLFQITPVLNTGLSLSEPLQLYKGYNAI